MWLQVQRFLIKPQPESLGPGDKKPLIISGSGGGVGDLSGRQSPNRKDIEYHCWPFPRGGRLSVGGLGLTSPGPEAAVVVVAAVVGGWLWVARNRENPPVMEITAIKINATLMLYN